MVAEWLWMMFGHSNVESIAQYNSIIRQFSDDGVWLTGAYGPHVRGQLPRVLSKLKADSTTRQAVIVMPRPMVETKDEPCTLSWHFMIRNGALNCVVNMRSSDIWLGVPYDVFSFTMLQNCIAGELHVPIGSFTLNCASSHLYDRDHEKAVEIYRHVSGGNTLQSPALPGMPPAWLDDLLVSRKKPEPTFEDHHLAWCMYADVLLAHGSTEALAILFETF
jgi:thymidylate synthase